MQKWEYWVGIRWADARQPEAKRFLKERWPDWEAPKYAPQALIPQLNSDGEEGWELVSIQPVRVGENLDVYFGEAWVYTNAYLCVLKRPKSE
jgi:hypothetical protein